MKQNVLKLFSLVLVVLFSIGVIGANEIKYTPSEEQELSAFERFVEAGVSTRGGCYPMCDWCWNGCTYDLTCC